MLMVPIQPPAGGRRNNFDSYYRNGSMVYP